VLRLIKSYPCRQRVGTGGPRQEEAGEEKMLHEVVILVMKENRIGSGCRRLQGAPKYMEANSRDSQLWDLNIIQGIPLLVS
jgi:hypothetical protein